MIVRGASINRLCERGSEKLLDPRRSEAPTPTGSWWPLEESVLVYSEQRQLGEERAYFVYNSSSRSIIAGSQGRNSRRTRSRKHGGMVVTDSSLAYITQAHLPVVGVAHRRLSPPVSDIISDRHSHRPT